MSSSDRGWQHRDLVTNKHMPRSHNGIGVRSFNLAFQLFRLKWVLFGSFRYLKLVQIRQVNRIFHSAWRAPMLLVHGMCVCLAVPLWSETQISMNRILTLPKESVHVAQLPTWILLVRVPSPGKSIHFKYYSRSSAENLAHLICKLNIYSSAMFCQKDNHYL